MSYKQIIATMCNTATHIRCYKNTKEKKKKKEYKGETFQQWIYESGHNMWRFLYCKLIPIRNHPQWKKH